MSLSVHGRTMIYLDNNATTPLDPAVLDAMGRVAREAAGNPGSRHLAGRRARQALEDARESIAEILEAEPREVIFTSGGTESSNLAITGLTAGQTGVVLLPPGEHPATEEPVRRLIAAGWQRCELPLDELGRIDAKFAAQISLDDVRFATAILAHNETGVIQNLEPLAQRCLSQGIPFHVDAIQAVGKIPVSFKRLPATTMSIAAHKFHGPRGIGALLLRAGTKLRPAFVGGFQEAGLRPGTEPVMLAVGMSVALRQWHIAQTERTQRVSALRDRLEQGLLHRCPPVFVNGDVAHRLPNTSNLSFPGCDGDALLIALDLAGVCCSLGSACASGSIEPSPVLVAMGLPEDRYRSALRLSVSMVNTEEEIDQAIDLIANAVTRLRARQ
ncbi:cysteine desulfurase family protein [Planctomicrobium piriforme]|uniref:Cysteine desulfurase n=1 Tax=Planctomicrobium piriforme TaxID=1576369 RepID=A0A1I3JEB1_9PLAN|nr:cysteine desulfurase family protein [Planctomicrobium piriforme]SFI58544.1 cysteine desulfurase [Planctomicrobium piriforme]